MSWARFDDRFDDNKHILAMSNDELAVYVCAITFCYREDNDGRLARSQALGVARKRGCGQDVIDSLVAQGRFELESEGYQIHDFGDYDLPEEVKRRRRQEAGRRSAEARRLKFGSADPRMNTQREHFEIKDGNKDGNAREHREPPYPVTRNPLAYASAPRARDSDHDEPTNTASGADPQPLVLPVNTSYVSAAETDEATAATACPKCHATQIQQRRRKSDGAPFLSCPDRACGWTADGELADHLNRPKLRQRESLPDAPFPTRSIPEVTFSPELQERVDALKAHMAMPT